MPHNCPFNKMFFCLFEKNPPKKKTTRTLKPDFPQKPTLHILPKPCPFCPWLDIFSPTKPGQHLPCQEESLRTPYPGQSASVDKTAIKKLQISLFRGGFMHPRWNIFGQQEGFSEIERRYPWRQQQPGKCFGTNEWELWKECIQQMIQSLRVGWLRTAQGFWWKKNIESEKNTSVLLTAPKNPTHQLGTYFCTNYWPYIFLGLHIFNIPVGERRISSNTRTLWHSPPGRCLGSQPMCRRAPWAKKNIFNTRNLAD